jgi:protein-L-isoaspartate(D-aspartate) O-methyltransferase
MDTTQARQAMVDRQVRPHDVTDLRILEALLEVPRENFLDPVHRALAYLDTEVPVSAASGRMLLKPIVFGKLLQAAAIRESDRVLDVGCATGYSAAVLARLAGEVVALEEDAALAAAAAANLAALGATHVKVVTGPLTAGAPQSAPYDVILLEGRSEVAPEALCAQLADRGRLLAVVGGAPMAKAMMYDKNGDNITACPLFDAGAPVLPGFVKPPEFVF